MESGKSQCASGPEIPLSGGPELVSSPGSGERDLLAALESLQKALQRLPDRGGRRRYRELERVLDERLPAVHAAYDAAVAEVLDAEGRQVTCRKGCSGCCRHYVDSVEPFEIAALHLAIRRRPDYADLLVAFHRRAALFADLRRAEGGGEEADDRALYRYFLRGVPCPFLDQGGACGIYARRPMSCRMFFSESSSRFCSGPAVASPWNRNFQVQLSPAVETAIARCSALLSGLRFPESLFAGLLAANAVFGRHDAEAAGPALLRAGLDPMILESNRTERASA